MRDVRVLRPARGGQFVALDEGGEVVGWCDVVRDDREGFRHAWRLGMGLLPAVRGRGVGRRLAEAAMAAARAKGAERIELEVFASNTHAIALYERLGFAREGVKRRARKLDGETWQGGSKTARMAASRLLPRGLMQRSTHSRHNSELGQAEPWSRGSSRSTIR